MYDDFTLTFALTTIVIIIWNSSLHTLVFEDNQR